MKGRPTITMCYTRIPVRAITVNYGMSLYEDDTTKIIVSPDQAYICGATLKLPILVQLHHSVPPNELIHGIQQQVTASSWQHVPSTSDTCLGEISPGWQKTASNGMLRTFLFSFYAVIRIKC